jgi:hypothetical protein
MAVGKREEVKGNYSELMATSVFCLVLPGEGGGGACGQARIHACGAGRERYPELCWGWW